MHLQCLKSQGSLMPTRQVAAGIVITGSECHANELPQSRLLSCKVHMGQIVIISIAAWRNTHVHISIMLCIWICTPDKDNSTTCCRAVCPCAIDRWTLWWQKYPWVVYWSIVLTMILFCSPSRCAQFKVDHSPAGRFNKEKHAAGTSQARY